MAYSAATGALLWTARYNGTGQRYDAATSVAVSPGGNRVYVTGTSDGGPATDQDYATVAYDAATGARLWVARYNGPGNGYDSAASVAVSPGGSMVFVTGGSQARFSAYYSTVAYRALTGAQLWVRRYSGAGKSAIASSVAVNPGGGTVYVTGVASPGTGPYDYGTVAYRASTGTRLWARLYDGPGHGQDYASAVVVSPDGRKVFVTGGSQGASGLDYATVAYSS